MSRELCEATAWDIVQRFCERAALQCSRVRLRLANLIKDGVGADTRIKPYPFVSGTSPIIHIRLEKSYLRHPVYWVELCENIFPHEVAHGVEMLLHLDLDSTSRSDYWVEDITDHCRPWSRLCMEVGGTGDPLPGMDLVSGEQYAVELPSGRMRYVSLIRRTLQKHLPLLTFSDGVTVDLAKEPLWKLTLADGHWEPINPSVPSPQQPQRHIHTHAMFCRNMTAEAGGQLVPVLLTLRAKDMYVALTVADGTTASDALPFHDPAVSMSEIWAGIRALRRFPFLMQNWPLRSHKQFLLDCAAEKATSLGVPPLWMLLYESYAVRRVLATLLPDDASLWNTVLLQRQGKTSDASSTQRWASLSKEDYAYYADKHPHVPFRPCCLPLGRVETRYLHCLLTYGPFGPKADAGFCERIYVTALLVLQKNIHRVRDLPEACVVRHYYGDAANEGNFTAPAFASW